jgi:hypothetical protein
MSNKRYNRKAIAHHRMSNLDQPQDQALCYVDQYGYLRYRISNLLVHREIAYYQIYLSHRKIYPGPFKAYVVHHKDGNKQNNRLSNLQLLTWNEHAEVHPHLQHHEGRFD